MTKETDNSKDIAETYSNKSAIVIPGGKTLKATYEMLELKIADSIYKDKINNNPIIFPLFDEDSVTLTVLPYKDFFICKLNIIGLVNSLGITNDLPETVLASFKQASADIKKALSYVDAEEKDFKFSQPYGIGPIIIKINGSLIIKLYHAGLIELDKYIGLVEKNSLPSELINTEIANFYHLDQFDLYYNKDPYDLHGLCERVMDGWNWYFNDYVKFAKDQPYIKCNFFVTKNFFITNQMTKDALPNWVSYLKYLDPEEQYHEFDIRNAFLDVPEVLKINNPLIKKMLAEGVISCNNYIERINEEHMQKVPNGFINTEIFKFYPTILDLVHPQNTTVPIGGKAYFIILNANLQPGEKIKWQYKPITAFKKDPWMDLINNKHYYGATTKQLTIKGSATQLNNNQDEYRAVFFNPKLKSDGTPTDSATLNVENIVYSDAVEVDFGSPFPSPDRNKNINMTITVNAGQSVIINKDLSRYTISRDKKNRQKCVYRFENQDWEDFNESASGYISLTPVEEERLSASYIKGIINPPRTMELKIQSISEYHIGVHREYILKIIVLGTGEGIQEAIFGSYEDGNNPMNMKKETFKTVYVPVGHNIDINRSITAGTDGVKIEYRFTEDQQWLPFNKSASGDIYWKTEGRKNYYYSEIYNTIVRPPRNMQLRMTSEYFKDRPAHVLNIIVTGIFAIAANLPAVTELPAKTNEVILTANTTITDNVTVQWYLQLPNEQTWYLISDGQDTSHSIAGAILTYLGSTSNTLTIKGLVPSHEGFQFRAVFTKA